MTMNCLSDIARWDDDGSAPIGHFGFMDLEFMDVNVCTAAKPLSKPANSVSAQAT
jgi:hypothetical protein